MEKHCSRFSHNCQLKSIEFTFKYFRNLTMLWKKESAQVGLAGLNPLEAARGAMFLPVFQDMPDPLNPQPVEITTPEEIPLVSVSLNIF